MTSLPLGTSRVSADATRGVGHLVLQRPEALNALDIGMVRGLRTALEAWRDEPDVERLLLEGAGERGLCAGGDVRGLAEAIMAGDAEGAGSFFREEYALNAAIAEYPKPIVVLADGVTMGGGIGLAGHAAVRVVTERSALAMPETRIGFTPDVGGTHLLARAPGRVGEYLALTGATMSAADAIYAGFADLLVPSDRLGAVREALESRADPSGATEIVMLFDESPEASALERDRGWIDASFAADDVPAIIASLLERPEPEASATARLLESLSPTALAVTLASVRAARDHPDLRATLEREYGLAMWFAHTQPDLPEGVRARLIDKDGAPVWRPATLGELPTDIVREALAYRPTIALWDRPSLE